MSDRFEYPQSENEFNDLFSSAERYIPYLFKLRWPNGFVCPMCGYDQYWESDTEKITGHYKCQRCKRKTSITAGTKMFNGIRKPFELIRFIWLISHVDSVTDRQGLSEISGHSLSTVYKWIDKFNEAADKILQDNQLSESIYVGTFLLQYNTDFIRWKKTVTKCEAATKYVYLAIALNDDYCEISQSLDSMNESLNPLLNQISRQSLPMKNLYEIRNYSEIMNILKENVSKPEKLISGGYRENEFYFSWKKRITSATIRMLYSDRRGLLFHKILQNGMKGEEELRIRH